MTVILNYGLGVDSTTILTRWLREPATRDFPLSQLTVLTAMTGDEFSDIRQPVETHILPQLRAHGVRYVQVARGGHTRDDGVVVLSDSRATDRLHLEGVYSLGEELRRAGTVPQVANRRCSAKAKGVPNDAWLATNVAGQFRQVMGFNADEGRRVERDSCYGGDNRNSEYPLMEWGWGREKCESYLSEVYGVQWPKSCCNFCPFSRGQEHVLARYHSLPSDAAAALYLEYVSLALNPNMTLFASGSLADKLRADKRDHSRAFRRFDERLDEVQWAVYRIRRVYHAKGRADREVSRVSTGTRTQCVLALHRMSREAGGLTPGSEGGISRLWGVRRVPDTYPCLEEMFVAAPADADDKAKKSFDETWTRVSLTLVES